MSDRESTTRLDFGADRGPPDQRAGALSEHLARQRARSALFGVPAPNPRLDRYRLIRPLGAGAMGQVWLAHDPALSREVAIKLVRPEDAHAHTSLLERLAREARSMAKLSHPNVVAVFDVGTHATGEAGRAEVGLFIVMELVDGPTLTTWLETTRSLRAIVGAFVQAAEGLAAAHEAGLVHRDFKPANVMIGRDGRVRVGDFGLARRGGEIAESPRAALDRERQHELAETLAGTLTQTGTVVGTPLYMSPEQHRGEPVDARSDQFAFFVALYEAVAGVRAFGGDIAALYAAKSTGTLAPPRRVVPARLLAVIRRGLSPDPDARWSSMRVVAAELRAALHRPRAWLWGGGVALVVLAAGLRAGTDAVACPAIDAVREAWSAERRHAVRRLVGEASSASEGERAVARLDESARALEVALEPSCSAHAPLGPCLTNAATQHATTAELLATDFRAAREAHTAITALPDPSRCDSDELVDDSQVAPLRVALARAQALAAAHAKVEAIATLSAARDDATELGSPARPLLAKLAHELGVQHAELGAHSLARDHHAQAYQIAREIGDDELAAMTAMHLAALELEVGATSESATWRRHAEALRPRARLDACEATRYEALAGMTAALLGDVDVGQARVRDAKLGCSVEACARQCANITGDLAELTDELGDHAAALALQREALALNLSAHGPSSSEVAMRRIGLAATLLKLGQVDDALAELAAARATFELGGAAGHRQLGRISMFEAQALRKRGDLLGALAAARAAVEEGERIDPSVTSRTTWQATLANALADVGDLTGALLVYDRALAEPTLDPHNRARVLLSRGYTRMEAGNLDAAVTDAVAARGILLEQASYAVDTIALSHYNEAEAHVRAGDCDRADAVFEAALEWAGAESFADAAVELAAERDQVRARCDPRGVP